MFGFEVQVKSQVDYSAGDEETAGGKSRVFS